MKRFHPCPQAVIYWKWNAFARRMLFVELVFFLLWLGAFNAFTTAFQVQPGVPSVWLLLLLALPSKALAGLLREG